MFDPTVVERSPTNPDFPGLIPGLMTDPYPLFARLRQGPAVFWAPKEGAWVLHRHAEVERVLSDRRFGVTELASGVAAIGDRAGKPMPTLSGLLGTFLPFINPPDHELGRRYYRAVLSGGSLDGAAEAITALTEDLLAAVPPGGRIDAAAAYAELLPPLVMAWFLGLPGTLISGYARASAELGRVYDRGCSPRFLARMEAMLVSQRLPIQQEVTRRRAAGRDAPADGLSRMIALADELRPMSDYAIADHAMALIFAATENTAALIGNSIAAWVEHKPQVDLSTASHDTFMAAVREVLRFDAPVQQLWRVAHEDLMLGDVRIAAGDRMLLLIGAAQRDPIIHADADRFDAMRFASGGQAWRSLSLGRGMHYCLGADLGLLEAAIALRQIALRHPLPDPEHPITRDDRSTLRRVRHLHLTLTESPRNPE